MTGKRFSVVLPVRNGGQHLKQCVASILAQTLTDEFELLVLENFSTDGSAEWLASLRDPRLRIHPAGRPLSIEENWARILQIPRGEFMTVIGHDDLLDPDYLTTMCALISEHPEAGLYHAHFRLIDAAGGFLRPCLPMPECETAAGFLAARLQNIRDSFGTGYLMRAADYDRVGGIPPYKQLLHADDALWMHLTAGSWKATSPRELFSYRYHGQSISGQSNPLVYLDGLEQYQDSLEVLSSGDPAIREVLARYGPKAYFEYGEYLHKRLLVRDLGGQGEYPADVPARLRRLTARFGDGESTQFQRKKRLKLLELIHRLPGGKWIFRFLRWMSARVGQQDGLND